MVIILVYLGVAVVVINISMGKRLTTTEFIAKANLVHGKLYDYSKTQYRDTNTKVCIVDPEYGEFWQRPNDHLAGHGSLKRGQQTQFESIRLTTKTFTKRAIAVHGKLYNYSKVNYTGANNKVCIIDPVYGEFYQTPGAHLFGNGCPERSVNGEHSIHRDHIIPLAILGSRMRGEVDYKRPLYKFLNSAANIQNITGQDNVQKSDWIEVNGKQLRARDVSNNYTIIASLSKDLLGMDISTILQEDQEFLASKPA